MRWIVVVGDIADDMKDASGHLIGFLVMASGGLCMLKTMRGAHANDLCVGG
jgi:hypothetical protein